LFRSTFTGVSSSFLQRFSFALSAYTGRHLLALVAQDLFHTKADARAIAAPFTGAFLLRGLCQVIAVFLAERTADFPVLPKVAALAG